LFAFVVVGGATSDNNNNSSSELELSGALSELLSRRTGSYDLSVAPTWLNDHVSSCNKIIIILIINVDV